MNKRLLSNNSSEQQQQQSKSPIIPCVVCGASSRGFVYGAIVCNACKIFFNRNAERELDILQCRYTRHCQIDFMTRHTCAHCRLAKCFEKGMQKLLIRCPISTTHRNNKRRKIINSPTISTQSALIPTLSLLRTDQSTLTTDQWILLSNLSHCYNDRAGLSIAEKYMFEQNHLPPKLRFRSASIMSLYQMLKIFYVFKIDTLN